MSFSSGSSTVYERVDVDGALKLLSNYKSNFLCPFPDFNPPEPNAATLAFLAARELVKPDQPEMTTVPKMESADAVVTQPPCPPAVPSLRGEEPTGEGERFGKNKSNVTKKPDKPVTKNHKCKTKAILVDVPTATTKKIEVLPASPAEPVKTFPVSVSKSKPPSLSGKPVKQGLPRQTKGGEIEQVWNLPGKKAVVAMEQALEDSPDFALKSPVEKAPTKEIVWSKVVSRQSQSRNSLTRGNKANSGSPPAPTATPTTQTASQSPCNQQATVPQFVLKAKQEVWSSSQDSTSDWGSEEMDLEELQAIYGCSTDDDKIRSQNLKVAAATSQVPSTCGGSTITRPVATTGVPTPTVTTTTSSSGSQQWQEVTRSSARLVMLPGHLLMHNVVM